MQQLRVRGIHRAPDFRRDRPHRRFPGARDQSRLAGQELAFIADGRAQLAARHGRERTVELEFPAFEMRIARRDEQLVGQALQRRGVVRRGAEGVERRGRIGAGQRRGQRRVVDAVLRGAAFRIATVAVGRLEIPFAEHIEARTQCRLVRLGESFVSFDGNWSPNE